MAGETGGEGGVESEGEAGGGPKRSLWAAIGPGILFAGAAIGVSHLVQSTRAGASYGLSLALLVIVANLIKYPAFRLGPHYATVTGNSLLEGYRQQGRWALALYGLLTIATMFTVQAAVTLVTAGLAKAMLGGLLSGLLGFEPSLLAYYVGLTVLCGAMLTTGGYKWLDRVGKVVVAVLTLSTLAATAMVLPKIPWGQMSLLPDVGALGARDIAFMAALVGWMPSAIDVSVWQSIWTLSRREETGHRPTVRESGLDFHIGYIGTAFLALCFLLLGAGVMHGQGELSPRAGVFAGQLIDLYAHTLGDWSRPIIALAALMVMFSTTLTVVDGFPRALSVLVERFRSEEKEEETKAFDRRVYWGALGVLALGSLVITAFLLSSLETLVDVATTASFLSAPLLSWLNHRAVERVHRARSQKGGSEEGWAGAPRWLRGASWTGIVVQALFALFFLWSLTLG